MCRSIQFSSNGIFLKFKTCFKEINFNTIPNEVVNVCSDFDFYSQPYPKKLRRNKIDMSYLHNNIVCHCAECSFCFGHFICSKQNSHYFQCVAILMEGIRCHGLVLTVA